MTKHSTDDSDHDDDTDAVEDIMNGRLSVSPENSLDENDDRVVNPENSDKKKKRKKKHSANNNANEEKEYDTAFEKDVGRSKLLRNPSLGSVPPETPMLRRESARVLTFQPGAVRVPGPDSGTCEQQRRRSEGRRSRSNNGRSRQRSNEDNVVVLNAQLVEADGRDLEAATSLPVPTPSSVVVHAEVVKEASEGKTNKSIFGRKFVYYTLILLVLVLIGTIIAMKLSSSSGSSTGSSSSSGGYDDSDEDDFSGKFSSNSSSNNNNSKDHSNDD